MSILTDQTNMASNKIKSELDIEKKSKILYKVSCNVDESNVCQKDIKYVRYIKSRE